jgi:type IV secretion system protein VirB10
MMRFGSSIMLSMVDDIFNVLAYKMTNKNGGSNSGNQIDYTENTRDNASNIASIALEKFINIKPTVYKQHGDLVDFSKVYKITKKK